MKYGKIISNVYNAFAYKKSSFQTATLIDSSKMCDSRDDVDELWKNKRFS